MYYICNLENSDQIPPFLRGVYLIYNRSNQKVYINHSDSLYHKLQSIRSVANRKKACTPIEYDIQYLGERRFDVHMLEPFDDEILSPIVKEEKAQYWVNVFQAYKPERGYNVRGASEEWANNKVVGW